MSKSKLSEIFERAFFDDGRLTHTCQCGRTHFATFGNEGCYEGGELERLRRKRSEQPDKFQEHDYSSLGVGYFRGKEYVQNCPCVDEELNKFEDFFWEYRNLISNYLNARLAQAHKDAIEDQEQHSIKDTPK